MALHLQHPRMTFIGSGESFTVYSGANANTLYTVSGTPGPMTTPTAHLTVADAKTFHGSIDLGAFADVKLVGLGATSYTYDARHDSLKLFQGNKVVETVKLHVDNPNGWAGSGGFTVQSSMAADGSGWVALATGYTGLASHIEPHSPLIA